MARRKPVFTQTDVSRALKAAQATGAKVQRFEVDPAGKIVVYLESPVACGDAATPLAEWRARRGAR
jgi:hypothetical protein